MSNYKCRFCGAPQASHWLGFCNEDCQKNWGSFATQAEQVEYAPPGCLKPSEPIKTVKTLHDFRMKWGATARTLHLVINTLIEKSGKGADDESVKLITEGISDLEMALRNTPA
jgi:hypothetical protein